MSTLEPSLDTSSCQMPCQAEERRTADITLSLRETKPAAVSAEHAQELAGLAAELEASRAALLACVGEANVVVELMNQAGRLQVDAANPMRDEMFDCLRKSLSGAVSVSNVPRKMVALLLAAPRGSGLSKEAIRQVIQRNISEMRDCLIEHEIDRSFRYPVRFEVGADGVVTCIEPVAEDRTLAAFTCCFLPRMARWQFPAPDGAESVIIQYPFVVDVEPAPAEDGAP